MVKKPKPEQMPDKFVLNQQFMQLLETHTQEFVNVKDLYEVFRADEVIGPLFHIYVNNSAFLFAFVINPHMFELKYDSDAIKLYSQHATPLADSDPAKWKVCLNAETICSGSIATMISACEKIATQLEQGMTNSKRFETYNLNCVHQIFDTLDSHTQILNDILLMRQQTNKPCSKDTKNASPVTKDQLGNAIINCLPQLKGKTFTYNISIEQQSDHDSSLNHATLENTVFNNKAQPAQPVQHVKDISDWHECLQQLKIIARTNRTAIQLELKTKAATYVEQQTSLIISQLKKECQLAAIAGHDLCNSVVKVQPFKQYLTNEQLSFDINKSYLAGIMQQYTEQVTNTLWESIDSYFDAPLYTREKCGQDVHIHIDWTQ